LQPKKKRKKEKQIPQQGGDENKSAQERKERKKERRSEGREAALLVKMSHIVSPQRLGTSGINTLTVAELHTYLGGVDGWSGWPMA